MKNNNRKETSERNGSEGVERWVCVHECTCARVSVCVGQRSTLSDLPQQAFPLPLRWHFSLVGQELPGSHRHPPASTLWWGIESMCHCTGLLMWVLMVELGSSHLCTTWVNHLPSLSMATVVVYDLPHSYTSMSLPLSMQPQAPPPPPPTKAFFETGSCSVAQAGPKFANQTHEDLKVIVSLQFLPSKC